jgi:hypothetical protein
MQQEDVKENRGRKAGTASACYNQVKCKKKNTLVAQLVNGST